MTLALIASALVVGVSGPGVAQSESESASAAALSADESSPLQIDAALSALAPAPTSSPRDTLQSFLALSESATSDLLAAYLKSDAENGSLWTESEAVQALRRGAIKNITRARTTMDLSEIAPANRRTVGINSVFLLAEILNRVPLPHPQDIPDRAAVEDGAAVNGWAVPGTEIQMIRSETLAGSPRYLFSPETIARLPEFYDAIRDLPRHSAVQMDFYQRFVSGPGLSMPMQFFRYVLALPSWALEIHLEQAVWQWILLVLLTVIYGGLAYFVVHWASRRAGQSRAQGVSASVQHLLAPVLVIAFLAGYLWLCDNFINLTGEVLAFVELTVETLQALAIAVLVVFVFNLLAAITVASPRIRKESLDASLVRLIFRVVGLIIAGFIIFLGATRIGLPAYGIVAGLGVGGLAIALAVRPTLENFIGGIILYADRPVKVGDFCQFGNMLGTVEEIGLRSTKVRSLNRTLVTVQNSDFAQMSITNFSRRDANLMKTLIRLRHETSSTQLTQITEGIAQMLKADPRVNGDSVRVCFLDIAESALDVEIWAYINSADFTQFLKIKESLLKKVMDIVEEHGSAFAMPSQTTYLVKGQQLPPAESRALRLGEDGLSGAN